MAIIVRHNGAAANALEGLERGLTSGFGFGLAINRQRREEKESEQFRQQALKRAQQIDAELRMRGTEQEWRGEDRQRQQRARGLAGEAFGVMSQSGVQPRPEGQVGPMPQIGHGQQQPGFSRMGPFPSQMTDPGPTAREQRAQARKSALEQLGPVLQRLAKESPEMAQVVWEQALERDKEAEQEAAMEDFREEVTRKYQSGAYRVLPDESQPEENQLAAQEKIDEQVQGLMEMAGAPNADPWRLRMMESQLTQSKVKQDSTTRLRTTYRAKLQADYDALGGGAEGQQGPQQAQVGSSAAVGPQPMSQPFNLRQQAQMSDLLAGFDAEPSIMTNPEMHARFQEKWEMAKQGMEPVQMGSMKIPMPYQMAEQVRQGMVSKQEADIEETRARARYYDQRGPSDGMTDYQGKNLELERDKLDFARQKARAEGLDLDGQEGAQGQPGVQPQTPQEQALVDYFRRTGKDPRNPQHREDAKRDLSPRGGPSTPPAAAPAAAPVAPAAAPQAAAPVAPAPAGGGSLSALVDAIGADMPTDRASAHALREALRMTRQTHAPDEMKRAAEAAVSELDALIEKNGWTATAAVRREAIRAAGELVKSFQSFIGGGDG